MHSACQFLLRRTIVPGLTRKYEMPCAATLMKVSSLK